MLVESQSNSKFATNKADESEGFRTPSLLETPSPQVSVTFTRTLPRNITLPINRNRIIK